MPETLDYAPDYTVPVWDTISEMMGERGWDQGELAYFMLDPETDFVSEEVNQHYLVLEVMRTLPDAHDITMGETTAKGLERAFGVSASFWMKRHETHRLACDAKRKGTTSKGTVAS